MSDEQTSSTGGKSRVPIDRGWAWVVVFSASIVQMICIGLLKAQGILFYEFMMLFERSSAETAWVITGRGILGAFVALVASGSARRFGRRPVVMLGGVFGALGFLLCSFTQTLVQTAIVFGVFIGIAIPFSIPIAITGLIDYFKEKRATANSLAQAGTSVGQIIIPTLLAVLIEEFSFRGALLLSGGIMLQITVCGALIRPKEFYSKRRVKSQSGGHTKKIILNNSLVRTTPESKNSATNGVKTADDNSYKMTIEKDEIQNADIQVDKEKRAPAKKDKFSLELSLFKNISFLFVFIGFSIGIVGVIGVFIAFPPFLREKGYSNLDAAYMLLIIGVSELITRLLSGVVLDIKVVKNNLRLSLLSVVTLILVGLVTFAVPFLTSYNLLLGYSAVFGAFGSQLLGLSLLVCVQCIGLEKSGVAMGYLYMMTSLSAAITPLFTGLCRDLTGSYDYIFYIFGISAVVGGILMSLEGLLSKKHSNENPEPRKLSADELANIDVLEL